MIAQKDVVFSNSMIEAINKIIKHQFLYPKGIGGGKQLDNILKDTTHRLLCYQTVNKFRRKILPVNPYR